MSLLSRKNAEIILLSPTTPFTEFKSQLLLCRDCRNLFGFEPKPLQWGEAMARVVIIGQAPSRTSSECGRPFSRDLYTPNGSGKRLMSWLHTEDETFYDPKRIYVTGVAHCYPGKSRYGDKKPPTLCADKWLAKELAYLKTQLFIAVGKYAADYLSEHSEDLKSRSFKELVFDDEQLDGKLAVFLPHPSAANQRWLKEHRGFETSRLIQIRTHLHRALG